MRHRLLVTLLLLMGVAPLRAGSPPKNIAGGLSPATFDGVQRPVAAAPASDIPQPAGTVQASQSTTAREARRDPSAELKTFVPSEKVRADVSVSFPVDI